MTNMLLERRAPKPGENFRGYILALTDLNGYDATAWLYQMIGWRTQTFVFSNGVGAEELSALTGVDKSRLLSLYYVPAPVAEGDRGGSMKSHVSGQRLSSFMIQVKKPKVCGLCLKEDNYLRSMWDLAPVTCCPVHKTLLLQNCPACDKPIRWSRNRVSTCKCGFDWRECEGERLEEKEIRISKHIYALCGLLPGGSTCLESSPIFSETLDGFLTALLLIASQPSESFGLNVRSSKCGSDITGKSIAPNLHNNDLHLLLNSALSVFDDWPHRYFDFLEWRLECGKKSQYRRGAGHDFGEFYVTLFRRIPRDIIVFMREAFTDYTEPGRRIRKSPPSRLTARDLLAMGYLAKRVVRERLNIDVKFLETLIQERRLKRVVHRVGRQHYDVIEAASLEKCQGEVGKFQRKSEVTSILGVKDKALMSLVEHELLVPARSATGNNNSWLFTERSVSDLLKNLSARVKESHLIVDTFDFDAAYKPASRDGCKFGQFISAVLTGEIVPCGVNPALGIKGLLFSAEQAKSYTDQISRKRKGDRIYLTDAAKLLGIALKVAFFLKDHGLLPAQKADSSSRPGFLVAKETVEQFKATYVQASEIARGLRIHSSLLLNLLGSAGINAVCGPKIDGRGCYFFRVSDMEAVNPVKLLAEAKAAKLKRQTELLAEAKAAKQKRKTERLAEAKAAKQKRKTELLAEAKAAKQKRKTELLAEAKAAKRKGKPKLLAEAKIAKREIKRGGGGATFASWLTGDLITKITDTVQVTSKTRSYVIAEAVRFGLKAVRHKYGANGNGVSGVKRGAPNAKAKSTKKAAVNAPSTESKAVNEIVEKAVDTEKVPYDRAAAARRAWVTIRANREAASNL